MMWLDGFYVLLGKVTKSFNGVENTTKEQHVVIAPFNLFNDGFYFWEMTRTFKNFNVQHDFLWITKQKI